VSVGPKQETEERPAYYGAVLLQEFIFAVSAALVMFLCFKLSVIFFPQWGVGDLAIPASGATLAYLLQEFLRRYFFCTRQSKLALITDIVSYLTQLPFIYWIAHSHNAKISNVLWIIAATSFAGFLACLKWFEPVTFGQHSFKKVFQRHWLMSRWLAPTAFMQWGAGNLFLMAAPVYYGAAASAIIRAANNIVGVAHIWFLGLDNVVPAEAARQMRLGGVNAMMRYIKHVIVLWGSVTLIFVSIVAAFPTFWLRLAYGQKYSSDGSILRLYALLYIFIFISGPLRSALQALEYTAPVFWAYPALIAFSVALAGPFARNLGLNGVMLGMCATQLVFQSFIGVALWLRIRKLRREVPSPSISL
jgi:O-antigen/teichoic acid export membrane protein